MKIQSSRGLQYLKQSLSDRERRTIMGLILLLALILFAGIWVISTLNLGFSQRVISNVRAEQIDGVFRSGWESITAKQESLERSTITVAHLAESYYRLAYESGGSATDRDRLWNELSRSLSDQLGDFRGTSGAGIWFNPGIFAPSGQSASIKSQVIDGEPTVTESRAAPNYRSLEWYQRLLEFEEVEDTLSSYQVSWTAVYFDLALERAQFTLSSPMFDSTGRLIGKVTTDWSADEVIDLVSDTQITTNSFSFLLDKNNRNLSSLSKLDQSATTQQLLDAVVALDLRSLSTSENTEDEGARSLEAELRVSDRDYALFYSSTRSGMVFGVGIPTDEIDAVLKPLKQTNLTILIVMGLILMGSTGYIIKQIFRLMLALRAAHLDSVTGLPNRHALFGQGQLTENTGLILINIDRFKELNSLFGQTCGDKVLESVGAKIQEEVRALTDSDKEAVYRLPGDEFLVKLRMKNASYISVVAQSLLKNLSGFKINWKDQWLQVDLSAGISQSDFAGQGISVEKLLGQATLALETGRKRSVPLCVYDSSQSKDALYEQNIHWAEQLRYALEGDKFFPYFQPIYSNEAGCVTKYECLIRMTDEKGDLVSPGLFLDIAHKLKMDRYLTGLMLDKCFAQFEKLPYEFSINLSYADITDQETVSRILDHLEQSGAGERVIFEMLESDGIDNYEEVLSFISAIKPYGAKFAIDDFGTGYSNFAHLIKLKVDIIKIDGSLIKSIDSDHNAYLVTQGLVQFAQRLGIQTVAEFVHNEKVQAQVATLGIDFSQGAYFGMPAEKLS